MSGTITSPLAFNNPYFSPVKNIATQSFIGLIARYCVVMIYSPNELKTPHNPSFLTQMVFSPKGSVSSKKLVVYIKSPY